MRRVARRARTTDAGRADATVRPGQHDHRKRRSKFRRSPKVARRPTRAALGIRGPAPVRRVPGRVGPGRHAAPNSAPDSRAKTRPRRAPNPPPRFRASRRGRVIEAGGRIREHAPVATPAPRKGAAKARATPMHAARAATAATVAAATTGPATAATSGDGLRNRGAMFGRGRSQRVNPRWRSH